MRSNFTHGFLDGLTIRNIPIQVTNPGKIFFVSNSSVVTPDGKAGANIGPGSLQKPFSTIVYALSRCVANRGDMIIVLPGHSEDMAAASAMTMVAGVTIVGMGFGSLRPKITFSTTASTIACSADNVSFKNINFQATVGSVVKAIVLTGKYLTLEDCRIDNSAAAKSFVDFIAASGAANTADGLAIKNLEVRSTETTNDSIVKISAALDGLIFINSSVYMGVNNNKSVVSAGANALTGLVATDNLIYRLNTDTSTGALFINSSTTCSGIIARNLHGMADVAGEIPSVAAGCRFFNNYTTSVDNTSGYLLPVVDS